MSAVSKSLLRQWLYRRQIAAIALIFKVLGRTLRIELQDDAGVLSFNLETPVIFAFWHEHLGTMPYVYQRYLAPRRAKAMISPSRDGQLIADTAERFGIESVRGSSFKHPMSVLREAVRAVRNQKYSLAITPDGPRGPRHALQWGVLELARYTQAPIIPMRFEYTRAWRMSSWDQFAVPQPFTHLRLVMSSPLCVPADLDEAVREKLGAQLAAALTGTQTDL